MSSSATSKRGRGMNKHYWTATQDESLVESLLEIFHDTKWKAENGFRNGYLGQLEIMLEAKLPGCGLKASPHIESRVKYLKSKYCALAEMLKQSGFGWNEEKMMVVCEKSVYDEWVKTHKDASGLYEKSFPHYHILAEIYGRDRAVGEHAGNADDDEEEIRREDASVHNLGVNDDEGENLNNSDGGSQFDGLEDFNVSFSHPSAQLRRSTQSTTTTSTSHARKKAKALDEMNKSFGIMVQHVAEMSPKLQGLIDVLSVEYDLTKMQARLDDELSKMDFLSGEQVFHVTNLLAPKHDLLRVFFAMTEERKRIYIINMLQYGLNG